LRFFVSALQAVIECDIYILRRCLNLWCLSLSGSLTPSQAEGLQHQTLGHRPKKFPQKAPQDFPLKISTKIFRLKACNIKPWDIAPRKHWSLAQSQKYLASYSRTLYSFMNFSTSSLKVTIL
jgi:hypothetical protein